MDAAKEREIIRLWNRLRILEREGRPVTAVLRQIKKALAERECHADSIRGEIERMRTQVHRHRGDIRKLQRAGISTASVDALLERMLNKIDELCAERDKLKKDQPGPTRGKVLGGRRW